MTTAQISHQMLPIGTRIPTLMGKTATIVQLLGQGGQGDVYLVDYDGRRAALKWYRADAFASPAAFRANLRHNVEAGSPGRAFVWPQDLTQMHGGSFGYLMRLIPSTYQEATDFFLHHVWFPSYSIAADACLNIVSAFRILHGSGYSYKDVNGSNFFIDPSNGNVLICDNDNVAPDSISTGIVGTPRFMAPEVVRGQAGPSVRTDRHSMAVLIFMLLCACHPLEGRRALVPVLDTAHQQALYGTDPLFIMDKDHPENGPDQRVHASAIRIWSCLPSYLRQLFSRAFSREALARPTQRPTEIDWIRALTRFRNDILRCHCRNEVFTCNGLPAVCDVCGKRVGTARRLHLSNYALPLATETRLFRCQVSVCNAVDALDTVARVIRPDQNDRTLGMLNLTDEPWNIVTPSGIHKVLAPNSAVPLFTGMRIGILSEEATVIDNT